MRTCRRLTGVIPELTSAMELASGLESTIPKDAQKKEVFPNPPARPEDKKLEHTGLVWRWKHCANGGVCEITPYCPECDLELKPHAYGRDRDRTSYLCPRCDKQRGDYCGHKSELEDLVKREIERLERLASQTFKV